MRIIFTWLSRRSNLGKNFDTARYIILLTLLFKPAFVRGASSHIGCFHMFCGYITYFCCFFVVERTRLVKPWFISCIHYCNCMCIFPLLHIYTLLSRNCGNIRIYCMIIHTSAPLHNLNIYQEQQPIHLKQHFRVYREMFSHIPFIVEYLCATLLYYNTPYSKCQYYIPKIIVIHNISGFYSARRNANYTPQAAYSNRGGGFLYTQK